MSPWACGGALICLTTWCVDSPRGNRRCAFDLSERLLVIGCGMPGFLFFLFVVLFAGGSHLDGFPCAADFEAPSASRPPAPDAPGATDWRWGSAVSPACYADQNSFPRRIQAVATARAKGARRAPGATILNHAGVNRTAGGAGRCSSRIL